MSKPKNKINNIEFKQADTKVEMLLLGYIQQELERVEYGKITFEITVSDSKMVHLQSHPSSKSFNLNIGLD